MKKQISKLRLNSIVNDVLAETRSDATAILEVLLGIQPITEAERTLIMARVRAEAA